MTFGQKDFEEIVAVLDRRINIGIEGIQALCRSPDLNAARRGYALLAGWRYRQRDWDAIQEGLDEAARRFPLLPPELFTLQIDLLYARGRMERIPEAYLDYGRRAMAAGRTDLGLEALGAGLVCDSQGDTRVLRDPPALRGVTDRYERAALELQASVPQTPSSREGPLTVGLLVPNLTDDTVAYSRRIGYFARCVDASRFAVRVYSTENMCPRARQLPMMLLSHPSPERAPKLLAELDRLRIPVWLAPRNISITDAVRQTANRMAADGVDILVMQAGPASPIDWLSARLTPVPVKLHLHIGVSNYMRGLDATLFDNAMNMEREKEYWPEDGGERLLVRRGTDLEALRSAPVLSRASMGLPEHAVIVGVLSNRLVSRLSGNYREAISLVLQRHPEAWFVAAGVLDGKSDPLIDHFKQTGVSERIRFLPQQRQPGSFLRMIDLYANEFPAGGSQSVVEAMGCGRPVAAMRCGPTHHESVGADLVGPPYAIGRYDPPAYVDLLSKWIAHPEARRTAGEAMRRRADHEFSAADFVRQVCELGETFYRRKTMHEPRASSLAS